MMKLTLATMATLPLVLAAVRAAPPTLAPPIPPAPGTAKPDWTPTWNLPLSTFLMPCNFTGYTDQAVLQGWGLIDFDWSNAKGPWSNAKPMDCEERLITQAELAKVANPDSKVFVYRNLVKALPWYTIVREKLANPAYSGWFLKFAPNRVSSVPNCTTDKSGTKCSEFYHDVQQTPEIPASGTMDTPTCIDGVCDCGEGLPCGEYLWDHRNGSMLRDFFVNEYILGANGLANPNVDGFYLDDHWFVPQPTTAQPTPATATATTATTAKKALRGVFTGCGATEEHVNCDVDMGLSDADVANIVSNWSATSDAVLEAVLKNKGFTYGGSSLFSGTGSRVGNSTDPSDPSDPRPKCAAYMRESCSQSSQPYKSSYIFEFTRKTFHDPFPLPFPNEDIAQFLLVRGPFGWIGHNWFGCLKENSGMTPAGLRPALLDTDVGGPVDAVCKETAPNSGVFVREWSKASVQLDCNTWTGTITPKA